MIRDVLNAFSDRGLKRVGDGWTARCPAHDDRKASLSIGAKDGKVLVHCHAGCATGDILAAVNLASRDLFEGEGERGQEIAAEYTYRDVGGQVLFQVVRFYPKDFRQRRPAPGGGWTWGLGDVARVLYRWPELDRAPKDAPVFVVEGEKDVDRLAALGLAATCNLGGAGKGKWRPEYSAALAGRNVVILPDNDEVGRDHAEAVAKALEGVAALVKVVALPGLPPKGDVSDWLDAGGTAEQLLTLAAGVGSQRAFISSAERLSGERQERLQMGAVALEFGVRFLDEALGGILARDVILLGAKTGVGKTELARIVALHNVMRGRRVHYFALEAEDTEIERRMKFPLVARHYYRTRVYHKPLRYMDWHMGRLDNELGDCEAAADAELGDRLQNLLTFYRFDSFTGDDFVRRMDAIKDDTDLVILDHLHYVDNDDDNENRGYKRTVKQIRDSALRLGKPVIVVAHVRKGDRRYEPLVPTVEDFHGSSDIPKIATKAVMLAPAYDKPGAYSYLLNTYMQVAKCRLDSSLTRYVALVTFNGRENCYEPEYTLGRLSDAGKTFSLLSAHETPSWKGTHG